MVQSMFAPDGEINHNTIWKQTPAYNQFMNLKLGCVFILEEGEAHPDSGTFDGGNEYTTAKTNLPIKASALSSFPDAKALIIEPANKLTFVGPFSSPVSSVMTLHNPTDQKICFKINTTAPKRYRAKPNSGIINPKQLFQVQVILQPFEYNPNDKIRHKFMVQSMFAPDGEINHDTLWKETTPGNRLMDLKLQCVLVLDVGGAHS